MFALPERERSSRIFDASWISGPMAQGEEASKRAAAFFDMLPPLDRSFAKPGGTWAANEDKFILTAHWFGRACDFLNKRRIVC